MAASWRRGQCDGNHLADLSTGTHCRAISCGGGATYSGIEQHLGEGCLAERPVTL
jgi:hypothetical protein